jgi:flagellar basal body rod protein FlgB
MKIDQTQPFGAQAGARAARISDSSARDRFSTALQEATTSNVKPTLPSGSLSQQNQAPNVLALFQPGRRESFNERALGLRAYRQELLASNIANADTPGYKAVDIDINEALRTGKSKDDAPVLYRVPAQGSIDGNSVDMDVERAQFSENAVMYEYTVDRVRGYYKMMDDLLKNTPY